MHFRKTEGVCWFPLLASHCCFPLPSVSVLLFPGVLCPCFVLCVSDCCSGSVWLFPCGWRECVRALVFEGECTHACRGCTCLCLLN